MRVEQLNDLPDSSAIRYAVSMRVTMEFSCLPTPYTHASTTYLQNRISRSSSSLVLVAERDFDPLLSEKYT